jgi:flagellar P-ring protein precursor FlgI
MVARRSKAPHFAAAVALTVAAVLCVLGAAPSSALAVQVQDLVRIKGAESSRIVGMGLVIGLNGTGDGSKSLTTMRRLATMMNRLGDPVVTATELRDAKNVAVVYLSARIPEGGVREGDQIDVQLAAPSASSLAGGRLVLSPLLGPIPGSPIYAFAEGPVTVEDPLSNRTAVVKAGATLTKDILAQYLDSQGRLTLVLDQANATWPMANTLATLINDLMAPDSPPIARAVDQKNIIIAVPPGDRAVLGAFISQVLEIQLDPSLVRSEARVVVNQRTGTIVMTENVEISPVVISHKGLTITTITPPPAPTADRPTIEEKDFIAVDPSRRGGSRLADLLAAFNQLKVPAEDRIAILKEIHRSGKLHAQLVLED